VKIPSKLMYGKRAIGRDAFFQAVKFFVYVSSSPHPD